MIPPERKLVKMAGYMEKKSKMKVMSRWKKLWFVLEGRLLTYYKSQLEYLSLSPCRGTVNMGLAASVVPGSNQEIIVSTRSHVVILRALSRSEHDVWLQALMDAMCLQHVAPPSNYSSKPQLPSRYMTLKNGRGIVPKQMRSMEDLGGTLPTRRIDPTTDTKIDKMTKKFDKLALSETSIPGKFRIGSTCGKELRRSCSVEDEFGRNSENIYESLKDVYHLEPKLSLKSKKVRNRVNRSDSDCFIMMSRERILKNNRMFKSEQGIRDYQESPSPIAYDSYSAGSSSSGVRGSKVDVRRKLQKHNVTSSRQRNGVAHSDTDLSVFRRVPRRLSSSDVYDLANLRQIVREKTSGPAPLPAPRPAVKKRSNSILRHFSKEKDKISERRRSVKKRSMSFLRKFWWRREFKWEVGAPETDQFVSDSSYAEMQGPDSDLENISDVTGLEVYEEKQPEPEPPPDYDRLVRSDSDDSVKEESELPLRLRRRLENARSYSPWDTPVCTTPSGEPLDHAPPLPRKTKIREKQSGDVLFQDTDPGLKQLFSDDSSKKDNTNGYPQIEVGHHQNCLYESTQELYEKMKLRNKNTESNYDVPRPHASLLPMLCHRPPQPVDHFPSTNFFGFEDSLDCVGLRKKEDLAMAPDSLECDAWSSSGTTDSWEIPRRVKQAMVMRAEPIYHDSLTPIQYVHIPTRGGYIQLHS